MCCSGTSLSSAAPTCAFLLPALRLARGAVQPAVVITQDPDVCSSRSIRWHGAAWSRSERASASCSGNGETGSDTGRAIPDSPGLCTCSSDCRTCCRACATTRATPGAIPPVSPVTAVVLSTTRRRMVSFSYRSTISCFGPNARAKATKNRKKTGKAVRWRAVMPTSNRGCPQDNLTGRLSSSPATSGALPIWLRPAAIVAQGENSGSHAGKRAGL